MDRVIYLAMTGAKYAMQQQATTAHNLANATTTGYKADVNSFRAVPVFSEALATRAYVADSTVGSNFAPGAIQQTGRDLDVAVNGRGWIAVQTDDGTEAYTRAGSLQINANGLLQTRSGMNVLGDGGPIAIPPDTQITISKDGTISAVQPDTLAAVNVVGRIKLVNPQDSELEKSTDGLFRLRNGGAAAPDNAVVLESGSLEASNVNVADTLVTMISQARHFDLQVKLIQNVDNNARQANQILNLNA